jgi:hypothetical protein
LKYHEKNHKNKQNIGRRDSVISHAPPMLGPKKGRNASLVNFKHLLKEYNGKGVKVQLL